MARSVRDTNLDTRTARSRLRARRKPYYRQLEPGLHLGYRRPLSGTGKWVARYYIGDDQYQTETFNTADDFSDADGVEILNYWQAVEAARKRMVQRAHKAAGIQAPLTVATAVNSYVEFLEANRKSGREARYAADAFILPTLGKIRLDALTTEQIRKWHHGLAKAGARIRTTKGLAQQFRGNEDDPEWRRRRKSTANRILTVLKAALNRAWRDGKIASDAAWRRVEPFENVESARVRYLSLEEARRLINAADPDFRKLVQAALETGARYGELCALTVADFNPDSGTIAIVESKSGKSRHVVLTDDGVEFFRSLAAGRVGTEPMFLKSDGTRWRADHQAGPVRDASARAVISPPINFHGLRHTWASHAVMNGMPLMIVARNLGHTSTRMVERHYGHLAPSFVVDTVRATAPRYGVKAAGNVKPLRP
jgi:integrase